MTNEQGRQSLQDAMLNAVRKGGIPVTIHVINGFVIKGALVKGFDSYVVLAEVDGKQMMVYKHAISTVTPEQKVELAIKTETRSDS